jgi:hypothetical protein
VQTPPQSNRHEQAEEDRAHDGADDDVAELARADERLADDYARQPPDDHTDSHLHVGEALILGEQGARERHEPVRQRQAHHDHVADVDAEGADHLCVVAGGAHGGAQVRAEEHVDQQAGDGGRENREPEQRGVARTHVPTKDVYLSGMQCGRPEPVSHRRERLLGHERHIGLSHDVQVRRIEAGHDQNARQQTVDPEPGMKGCRDGPRERPGGSARGGRQRGVDATDEQRRGDGRAEGDRSVSRNVREGKDAEADEDAERQEREDQSDREGSN